MRIAILAFTVSHAGGEYTAAYVNALSRRGHDVIALIPSVPWIPLDERVVRVPLPKPRSRAGVLVVEALGAGTRGPVDSVLDVSPDVAHVVFGDGYPRALSVARRFIRHTVPVGVTVHDPEPHPGSLAGRSQNWVARRLLRRAAGVHVHCERQRPQVLAMGGRGSVLVYPHPALPCPRCPVADVGGPRAGFVFFGRFTAYKGLDVLAAATAMYWDSGGRHDLLLLGTGRVPTAIADLVDRYGQRVEVRQAYLAREELHDVLSRAAAGVLPYTQATQSAAPLWVRSHGARLIASDVGCLGEATRSVGGDLVPPGDVEALAAALLRADRDPGSASAAIGCPSFDDMAGVAEDWYHRLGAV